MQPPSRRVGGISARNSASRRDSWPGLACRRTTRVTAFLGSLAAAERRGLRLIPDFLCLRLGIVAGLYSKEVFCEGGCRTKQHGDAQELFFGQPPPGVQIVEIQDGVQDQRVGAAGFAAINRVDREQDDVPAAARSIQHRGMLRDLVAALY